VTLAEVSIQRPVFTIVVSLLILLFGAVSVPRLAVREYPSVDPPTISITTSYPGAAAEIVQAQITEPIEEAVNTVAGIDTLTSNSREGSSVITAQFSLDTDWKRPRAIRVMRWRAWSVSCRRTSIRRFLPRRTRIRTRSSVSRFRATTARSSSSVPMRMS
jgi:multidrug efflux pump subunit AcrB